MHVLPRSEINGRQPLSDLRKLVRASIERNRQHIIDRILSNGSNPADAERPSLRQFAEGYIDAVLALLNGDARSVQRPLEFLRTLTEEHPLGLSRAQELLLRFKPAIVHVLMKCRRWRAAELVQLHAALDETVRVSVQEYGRSFEAADSKRTVERLHAQGELLNALVSDCADAIIISDMQGRIRSWNVGAQRTFGYAPDEVIGRPFSLLIPKDLIDRGELDRLERNTVASGAVRDVETERVTKDGKRIRVSVTRTALRNHAGKRIGTSAIVRDITERKALEVQLVHADRLATMGTMAAGLAHEIGNPLGAISSLVQLLRRRIDDPDLLARLDLVLQQVSRLTTIVREMAAFSRPGAGSQTPAQISEVVQHAVTLARYSRSDCCVEIDVRLDPNLPVVPVGADRLLQVFLNLVLNAFDAMHGQGRLQIEGSCCAGAVEVRVSDSGPGVPAALRARIFEPFFTTKAPGRGTGMGLSVSQRIVHACGGTIAVGEAAAGGAAFTVRLPVSPVRGRDTLRV